MIGPFFDALLDETDLRPFLILQGDNSTGKTQIAKLITKKIWGNFEEVIAPNNLQSDSRTDDYLSTSTFGEVFDDADNVDSKHLGKLKSYTTSEKAHKYRIGQKLLICRVLSLSIYDNSQKIHSIPQISGRVLAD
jgi:hypothetical protein